MVFRMYHTEPNRSNLRKQCSVALHRYLGTDLGPAELRAQCRDIFKRFDADGSGRIDMGELLEALSAFGVEDLAEQALPLSVARGVGVGCVWLRAIMLICPPDRPLNYRPSSILPRREGTGPGSSIRGWGAGSVQRWWICSRMVSS